jgi:hypothetical protein
MNKQFQPGEYRLVVYMLDGKTGLAAETDHEFEVFAPPDFTLQVLPERDRYMVGQTIRVLVELTDGSPMPRTMEFLVPGERLQRIQNRLRAARDARKVFIPVRIRQEHKGELDILVKATGPLGISVEKTVTVRVIGRGEQPVEIPKERR